MKKRIKNKHLPKFDFSGDLSSINRAKSATATVTGPTVPLANGLTQQASDNLSFDSGLSSTPNFGMSTKTGNIIGGVGRGIEAMSSFIPEDNDGHGVSRTGQKISSGIQKGMDTAGEVASSFGPVGQTVGGVLKLGSFLVKGFTALADAVKEQKNPKDEKWDKQYNVVNPNASKLDFGVPQAKFGMPLFNNGGKVEPIYTDNLKDKRLQAYNDSLSLYKAYEFQKQNYKPGYEAWLKDVGKSYPGGVDALRKEREKNIGKPLSKQFFDKDSKKSHFKSSIPDSYYDPLTPQEYPIIDYYKSLIGNDKNYRIGMHNSPDLWHKNINPIGSYYDGASSPIYKKPVQPVIYKKKEVEVPVPKVDYLKNLPTEDNQKINLNFPIPQAPNEDLNTKGNTLPGFLVQKRKTINGEKTYIRKDNKSPWMEQYALGGDPRAQSDIEAEQGEAMLISDNTVHNIEGQKHEQGGTPLKLKGNEQYIYSDRLGYDKGGLPTINIKDVSKSFADKAKSIERKYKAKHDLIAEKTKELEINTLIQDAEQARQLKEQVDMSKDVRKMQAKYGKDLRKFLGGGDPDPNNVIMTPEEMKALYEQLNLQAKGVSSGLNTTIGEMKQTSQQLDANTQRLQQMSNPQINAPLYNLSSKYNSDDSQTEPITLNTPWGTYDRSGNLKNGISPITPIGPRGLGVGNTQVGITNTPTTAVAGTTINVPLFNGNLPSGPQQDMNGIDIEKPGDDFGAGIGVYGKQPSAGRNGLFKNLTTGDKLGLASMLPGTLYNFAMGLKPAEREKFYTNPYQNEIVRLMQNRKFDPQSFINEATMANEAANQNISDNASSVGVKLANMQKAQANYVNSLASITGKAQEINNNYRAEEAQVKNNLGEVLRQEGIRQARVNAQNKAAKQAFMTKAMTQLGQGIAAVGQASNQSLTNTILAKSLSELSPDFDVKKLKDLYDRGQVDESGYFIFNGSKYQYIPSQTGRAEDGQVVKVTQDLGLPINKKTLYPPMTFTTTTTKKGK